MQSDWVRYLASAEFSLNNLDSKASGVSPFLAVYVLHPRSGSELSPTLSEPTVPSSVRFERLDANDIVNTMQDIEKSLQRI